MARDDDYDERISAERPRPRPYSDDDEDHLLVPHRHSGFGVASFVIALVTGIVAFLSIGYAAWLGIEHGPLQEDDPAVVLVGLLIIGSSALSLVGLVLGLVGMFQSNRRIVFAVLGTVFNVLLIFGICGLLSVGFAMGGH